MVLRSQNHITTRHLFASNSVEVELNFMVEKLNRISFNLHTQSPVLSLQRFESGGCCSCCITNTSLFLETLSECACQHTELL